MKYTAFVTSLVLSSCFGLGSIAPALSETETTATSSETSKTEAKDESEAAPDAPAKSIPATDSTQTIQSKKSVEWVPLARINPAKPVTIELNNKTDESLEYLITTHTNFRSLAPGQSAKLLVTDFPAFVNVNAKRSVGVKYLMKVQKNKISVDLKITPSQGDTTLNIHQKGAIYLY